MIDNIFLNEACSSGCGSFLQTFAGALGYSIADFAKAGLFADKPVDLGSRCTVFMNSSVKQAQKDGASIENISAGLSISVVKNALYKVIRVGNASDLGQHIVVQGGTFLNDAVLRAFEQEIGHDVIRPSLSGIMGAMGAALYAMAHQKAERSSLLSPEELKAFTHQVQAVTCNGCTNHCRLTINTFAGGKKFIGGNQCAKPLRTERAQERYDLYDYKRELLAQYGSVKGTRQNIGLPMGLNFYELLPFWHTFLTALGFGVTVSPKTTKALYHLGQTSIPSDTACYPAKLMHGHVQALLDEGVDAILYPCMSYNFDEHLGDNHYNCPVVAYYPEVIASNMKSLSGTPFIHDYVGIHRPHDFPKKMHAILVKYFGDSITLREVKEASKKAYAAYDAHMRAVRDKGEEYLRLAKEKGLPVIVLCGRPYHLDGEINHGIDGFIADSGAVVVSEDSLGDEYVKAPTTVLNQWTYHSRLYAAARYIANSGDPHINLVQLVSFGCGVDAITTDEVRKILEGAGRIYTQIKIDEITNLGAVKIRLRSLFSAIGEKGGYTHGRIEFTKEMRKTYKLLFPNMAEIHFRILQNTFRSYGYNVELLTNDGQEVVDEGLKYVHNDICYPALLTIGQMISALKSGKYDLNHVALMMTQTGGGCRASNYIFLLRKALKNAGMGQVPVVSVNLSGLEKNSGFKITLPLLRRALAALTYGDLLMLLRNQTL